MTNGAALTSSLPTSLFFRIANWNCEEPLCSLIRGWWEELETILSSSQVSLLSLLGFLSNSIYILKWKKWVAVVFEKWLKLEIGPKDILCICNKEYNKLSKLPTETHSLVLIKNVAQHGGSCKQPKRLIWNTKSNIFLAKVLSLYVKLINIAT